MTEAPALSTLKAMEVHLNSDLQARLADLAARRGRDTEALAREAIERLVDYDEWFVREVEKGLAQIEQGKVLTQEEVGARIEKRAASVVAGLKALKPNPLASCFSLKEDRVPALR